MLFPRLQHATIFGHPPLRQQDETELQATILLSSNLCHNKLVVSMALISQKHNPEVKGGCSLMTLGACVGR